MTSAKRVKEGKICEICGYIGKAVLLVTCYHCKRTTQHIYCMRNQLLEVPSSWCCEGCQCLSNASMVKNFDKKSLLLNKPTSMSCARSEGQKRTGGSAKTLQNCNKATEDTSSKIPKAQKTEVLPPKEFVSLGSHVLGRTNSYTSADSKAFSVIPQKNVVPVDNVGASNTPEKCITTGNDNGSTVPKRKESGTSLHSDSEFKRTGFKKMNQPLVMIPMRQVCWTGKFKVFDLVSHEYTGIKAQYPSCMSLKVYEIAKHLPEVLNLKVLQRDKVWPQNFQLETPTESDIGLYFFSSESERHKEKYMRLLDRLESNDQAMKGLVNDVELLVFVSNQLTVSQRIDGQKYLWVVFRHLRHKKLNQQRIVESHSSIPNRRDCCAQLKSPIGRNKKEVDMVKEQETGRTDQITPNFDPDIPPKFSNKVTDATDADIPPGFTEKLSFQLKSSIGRNKKEVDMVKEQETGRTDQITPNFDPDIPPKFSIKVTDATDSDTPPGFTEKMSSKHRKKSPETTFRGPTNPDIPPGFTNKVTDATDPDIPPGFTEMSSKYRNRSPETTCTGPTFSRMHGRVYEDYAITALRPREVHPMCHQDSDNCTKSAVHLQSSNPVCSVEENKGFNSFNAHDNGTKLDSTVKNLLPSSSIKERECSSSAMKNSSLSQKIYPSSNPVGDKDMPISLVSDSYNSSLNNPQLSQTDRVKGSKNISPVDFFPEQNIEGTEKVENSEINKSSQVNIQSEFNCEEDYMEVDMVGGIEIGKIDVPIPRVDGLRNVGAVKIPSKAMMKKSSQIKEYTNRKEDNMEVDMGGSKEIGRINAGNMSSEKRFDVKSHQDLPAGFSVQKNPSFLDLKSTKLRRNSLEEATPKKSRLFNNPEIT